MLVVSHTTGAEEEQEYSWLEISVTSLNIFTISSKLFIFKPKILLKGRSRFSRGENGVLGGVAVSASDIIERCPHQIATQLYADDSEMGE